MRRTAILILLLYAFAFLLLDSLSSCKKAKQCEYLQCRNGGYCDADTCVCKPGYVGALCENFSICDTINCLNGGACSNGSCLCPDGYEGPRCASLTRDQYIGNYKGTLTLDGQSTPIPATAAVKAGTTAKEVVITLEQISSMKAELSSGGVFTIPSQSATIGTVSGNGSFSGTTLSFSFAQNIIVTTINGSFTGTKQ